MTIEADCFRLKKKRDEVLEQSLRITPGSSKKITFFKQQGVDIMVFCNADNTQGTIAISGHRLPWKVSAKLFESEEDNLGKFVYVNGMIQIKQGQELILFSRRGPKKEIDLYLGPESNERLESSGNPDALSLAPVKI